MTLIKYCKIKVGGAKYMIISVYNICKGKDKIIESSVENQKNTILDRVYSLENSFYLSFYELAVEFTVIDAYEFFVEIDCQSNIFYENLNCMNEERGKRFFKIMAIYHTIKILRKKRDQLDFDETSKSMFYVYEFDKEEERLCTLLYSCAVNFDSKFPILFAKSFGKYLFGEDIENLFTLAFIENFCYNSFNSFLSYLSKYISINRRIKLAQIRERKQA